MQENNQLTAIPLYLSRLARNAYLNFENNPLTERALIAFQDAINETRAQNPNLGPRSNVTIHDASASSSINLSSLEETVSFFLTELQSLFPEQDNPGVWENRSKERFPESEDYLSYYQSLFSHKSAGDLYTFLNEIVRKAADYKNPRTKGNVVLRIDCFLEAACTNQEFRDQLFMIVYDATRTCGDGAGLVLNRIEKQMRMLCDNSASSDIDLAKLVVGLARVDVLDKVSMEIIKSKRVGDPAQVYLYYQVELKNALGLPLSTEGMLYTAFTENMLYGGMGSVVKAKKEQDLAAVKEKVLGQTSSNRQVEEILLASSEWKLRLRKYASKDSSTMAKLKAGNSNQLSFEEIENNYISGVGEINDKFCKDKISPGELQISMDALLTERNEKNLILEVKVTQKFVTEHLASIG